MVVVESPVINHPATFLEAQEVIGQWRSAYNHRRSHSSLDGLTPAAFAFRCAALTPVTALPTFKRHSELEIITQSISSYACVEGWFHFSLVPKST